MSGSCCPPLVSGVVVTSPQQECEDGSSGGGGGASAKKGSRASCFNIWEDRLVMSPPFYGDIGKQARDVFGKGYHFGLVKLQVKTKTESGVEFTTGGESEIETKKVTGNIETKYKFKDYGWNEGKGGITFTEKWNTDNILSTEVSLADFCDGAKIGLESAFTPKTGDKGMKVKAEFKNNLCAVNMSADFKRGQNHIVKGAGVLGYKGFLCGYQTAFDMSDQKLKENSFAMGYIAKEFILSTNINDGKNFGAGVYHQVNKHLETGVQISWHSDKNETNLGIGAKYNLDPDSSLRVKVDNQSMVGIGYAQTLRSGVTLFLSTLINAKNINEGGHKLGLCLEIEA